MQQRKARTPAKQSYPYKKMIIKRCNMNHKKGNHWFAIILGFYMVFFVTGNPAFAAVVHNGASLAAAGSVWEITDSASFNAAVADIKAQRDQNSLTEATIVFTQDMEFDYDPHPDEGYTSGTYMDSRYVGKNYFSGIEGVTLTLTSKSAPVKLKNLGATFGNTRLNNTGFYTGSGERARFFTGPMVLDHIVLDTDNSDSTYYFAQGHTLIFTENFASTEEICVVGGNLGTRRRLDGLGFGDADGKGPNGQTLGWIEESAGVASTRLEIYGGHFGYIYGGGYNSDVQGDAHVKVALPESNQVGHLYGGSVYHASYNSKPSEGTLAYVRGSTHVNAVSGKFINIFGGADGGRVDGDAHVTLGLLAGDQKAFYGEVFGGGNQATLGTQKDWDWVGGNTHVTINPTATERDDTASIHGGGSLDTINGTTEVVLNGGSNNHWIFAGGSNSDDYSEKSSILNRKQEKVAAKITINGGAWNNIYANVETSYSSTAEQLIDGDALITFNDGTVNHFCLSAHRTHITGDSILTINGGTLGTTALTISGYQSSRHSGNTAQYGTVDGKRIVNIKNSHVMRCYRFYAIDEINVSNTAPFIVCDPDGTGALRSCGNINIQAGTLALTGTNDLINMGKTNGKPDVHGDFTIAEGGTLALNGTNDVITTPGCINALGTATGKGKLLVVKPSGSPWISTDMTHHQPKAGEVYLRSNATTETAIANSRATILTLANNEPTLYVEYTTENVATANTYSHAWRIAEDKSVKVITVTFDKNGGDTEAVPGQKQITLVGGVISGTIDALPAAPTRTAHRFTGWNTQANGQGINFTAATPVDTSITVYAQWEKMLPDPTYTVIYTDGVDGEEVFADQIYMDLKHGEKTPDYRGAPSRAGYKFANWLPEVAESVTQDITYTAQWTKNEGGGKPIEPDKPNVPPAPPQTGDKANVALWLTIVGLSGSFWVLAVALSVQKRKRAKHGR